MTTTNKVALENTFFTCPEWREMSGLAVKVLLSIAFQHANTDEDVVDFSAERLAEFVNAEHDDVAAALAELIRLGVIDPTLSAGLPDPRLH